MMYYDANYNCQEQKMLAEIAVASAINCTWDRPGANPYRGPVTQMVQAAVARYELPVDTQWMLVDKVKSLNPDGYVVITRDGLASPQGQVSDLRDMHYGKATMCSGPVSRAKWTDDQSETAFIYCAREECIAIPVICGNVSRIKFQPLPPGAHADSGFRAWKSWTPLNYIPTPSTMPLVAIGLAALVFTRRR